MSVLGQTVTITSADKTKSESLTFDAGVSLKGLTFTDTDGRDLLSLCFMAGTLVRTPDDDVAVETLKRGDLVLTNEGQVRPVTWLGRQTMSARFAHPLRNYPIRIRAGALADNVPSRDLLVSPAHALLVDDVLIVAGAGQRNLDHMRKTVPDIFIYYHVELEDHAPILAENAPAETFVDNVDRLHFDNWAEHEAIYPDGKSIREMPYPRAKARRQVPHHIRAALSRRAEEIGAAPNAAA
jgi:serralysin